MDHSRRGGRQNEQPVHQTSQSRYQLPIPATQGSSSEGGATSERYRPTPLNLSTSTPRSMGVAGNYSSYYQDPPSGYSASSMSSTLLAYGTDGTQTPGFGSYNAGMMMYNVPHTAAQQAVYDTQQFTPRQHAGMQIMPSDVASTYFASDATGAAASSLQAGQGSSASSNVYQHHNPGIGYPSSMSELQQQSSGTNPGTSEGRDVSSDDTMAMKWSRYQRQLGTVFQDVKDEQLERASKTLLDLSNWLLPQVSQLGTSNQRRHPQHSRDFLLTVH